jgi:hypothetical protein
MLGDPSKRSGQRHDAAHGRPVQAAKTAYATGKNCPRRMATNVRAAMATMKAVIAVKMKAA